MWRILHKKKYSDIINLEHHTSKTRPKMSIENISAQFDPFAALTGYEDMIEEDVTEVEEKIKIVSGVNGSPENVAKAFYETLFAEESTYEEWKELVAPHEEYLDDFDEENFKKRRKNWEDNKILSVEATDLNTNYAEKTIKEYADNLAENGYELEELTSVSVGITIEDHLERIETIPKEVSVVKINGRWYVAVEYYLE